MRLSKLFARTWREAPAEAELASHQLMLRAGYIRRLAAGIYSYLPLGWRVIRNIQEIIRQEMDAIDGQELNMPVVHPAELWQESGRWHDIGPELARFKDRGGRNMVLGMTHEEVVTDLARREVDSHRQLPFMVYQIQTKFRDEPRSRGGLIRVREFMMKDGYSFHPDQEDLDRYYPSVCQAYFNICRRCGVEVAMVASDVGMMGGTGAHEFMLVTPAGEDTLVLCRQCGYAANQDVAEILRKGAATEAESLTEVATPGQQEVVEVARFLGKEMDSVLKTLVVVAEGKPVLACIRGDLEVNERKLANCLGVGEVRLAQDEELTEWGLVGGYVSPVGNGDYRVVVDPSVVEAEGLVAGANREGYHFTGARFDRDFSATEVTDIARARTGDSCVECQGELELVRGVEIGNTFKLGLKYSESMGARFLDQEGTEKPLVMGCYGIGLGRLAACVVESHHDDKGIIWPLPVAPYQVHLVSLGTGDEVTQAATGVYDELTAQGISVLYDDRNASAGVKFNDADLMGMPLRITVSKRNLKESAVEVKARKESQASSVALDQLVPWVQKWIQEEMARYQG